MRAEETAFLGSKYSAYLVTVKQGHQLVRRSELPAFERWWYGRINGLQLLSRISPQINLGRLNIVMTQPKRNLPDVSRGLKHQHGARVPQDVR